MAKILQFPVKRDVNYIRANNCITVGAQPDKIIAFPVLNEIEVTPEQVMDNIHDWFHWWNLPLK